VGIRRKGHVDWIVRCDQFEFATGDLGAKLQMGNGSLKVESQVSWLHLSPTVRAVGALFGQRKQSSQFGLVGLYYPRDIFAVSRHVLSPSQSTELRDANKPRYGRIGFVPLCAALCRFVPFLCRGNLGSDWESAPDFF
jgi:hypothetical protein